jgi:conjugal transfer pilin signal peptidase TrbI
MRRRKNEAAAGRCARYLAVLAGICLLAVVPSPYKLALNRSDSLPGLLYVIHKGKQPQKGELVAFWPPPNRFYKHTWFVKRLVGVAGDVVSADLDNQVFVDGRSVGIAKKRSKTGMPLMAPVVGVIPPEHFFAATRHPDGFDSRYGDIGFVHVDRIIGRAHRIL